METESSGRSCHGWRLALLILAAAGCQEVEQAIWLNPDGSGRIELKLVLIEQGKEDRRLWSQSDRVLQVLDRCEGIEVWDTVRGEREPDGSLCITGTAYFRDLGKVRLPAIEQGFRYDWRPADSRQWVFALQPDIAGEGRKTPVTIADDDFVREKDTRRAQYRRRRPLERAALEMSPRSVTVHLPGRVSGCRGMERSGDFAVRYVLDVDRLMESKDAVVAGDESLRTLLAREAVREGQALTDMALERLGPLDATVVAPFLPQFDYKGEVARIKTQGGDAWREMIRPAVDGVITNAPASGMEMRVLDAGWTRELLQSPAGVWEWSAGECRVRLQGVFASPVTSVRAARVNRVETTEGTVLGGAGVRYELGRTRQAVLIDLTLRDARAGLRGLRELQGTVECEVPGETVETDLGFRELKAGATGTVYRASITDMAPGIWLGEKGMRMRVRLEPPYSPRQTLVLMDEAGNEVPCVIETRLADRAARVFELRRPGEFPARGSIRLRTGPVSGSVAFPFAVRDLSLDQGIASPLAVSR